MYRSAERKFSGRPNPDLVAEAAELPPGRVLDLGCGEGGDALWLAGRGWRVTAVDISGTALARGAEDARRAGLDDRIDWLHRDLTSALPDGPFDLVSSHYLYLPDRMPVREVLRPAAGLVAPGGVFLVGWHGAPPAWAPEHHHEMGSLTPDEVLAQLDLPAGEWRLLLADTRLHGMPHPEGRLALRADQVLKLRRAADEDRSGRIV
ncbi:class I SAM-dependent methyltransferase [Streptomyces hainanensis]|uniref:Class I SAM-dependent methyltransferase n=2 Tax=Streptomyces hainanensis TaxID=402648 RepID=A0A4R4SIS0_9ACTN|nr:class I SAM-dependent methyltransferase [Streptomyces hainanensis]